jgi:hypothetical protein
MIMKTLAFQTRTTGNILNYKCGTKTDSTLFYGWTAIVGLSILIVSVSRLHSDTPHSVGLSGRLIGPSQRPQLDNI